MGRRGFFSGPAEAVKGAAGCAVFISTLEGEDGPRTLVERGKRGHFFPVA